MAALGGYWKLADLLRNMADPSSTMRTTAVVQDVDGDGVVWVVPAGSEEAVPVNGVSVASARSGETVTLEISGGRASILGNASDPAVGASHVEAKVSVVQKAIDRVAYVLGEATAAAKAVADEAKAVAEATNQHFWTDANGIHVTQEEREDFATNGGPNILVNSSGVLLRNALNWLAQLTPGAVAFYDGNGNAISNLMASFGPSGVMQYVGGVLRSMLDSSGLSILDTDGTTSVASFAATTRVGKASSEHISISSTALELLYGTTSHFKVWLESSKVKFRIGASSGLHLLYDASVAAIKLMSNTTELARFGVNSLLLHGGLLSIISDAGGGNSGTTISSGSAKLWLQAAVVYVTGALSLTTPLGTGSGGTGQAGVTAVTVVNTVVTSQTNVTVTSVNARKWGPIMFLKVAFKFKSNISVPADGNVTNITLMTLASGYRPVSATAFHDTYGDVAYFGDIAADGTVTLRGANAKGSAYTLSKDTQRYMDAIFFTA